MESGTAKPSGGNAEPKDVVDTVRSTYLQFRSVLVRCLRGAGVTSPSGTEISKALGLTRQLSWQLATIVAEPDVATGLPALPGTRGLTLLVNSLHVQNIERGAELKVAIDRLEDAIRALAGDRTRLDLLTAAWGPDGLDTRSELLRREAYRVQSALFGVNASAQVRGIILAPSRDDPTKLHLGSYSYFGELVRYRRDRRCRLAYVAVPWNSEGDPVMPAERMREHVESAYLFRPELSNAVGERVDVLTQGTRGWVTLAPGPLGVDEAVDLAFTGRSNVDSERFRSGSGDVGEVAQFSFVPTERYVVDVLTTREVADEGEFDRVLGVACFDAAGGLPVLPATPEDPAFLYHLDSKRPIASGAFDVDPATSTLTELIEETADGVGLSIHELVGYRFSTRYTLAGALTVVSRRLPGR